MKLHICSSSTEEVISQSLGRYNSLALDSGNKPRVSFYNDVNQKLGYAYHDGDAWQETFIASDVPAEGLATSLALDKSDLPHISFVDHTNRQLKYTMVCLDPDGDGQCNNFSDNCPEATIPLKRIPTMTALETSATTAAHVANPDQKDSDGDGMGRCLRQLPADLQLHPGGHGRGRGGGRLRQLPDGPERPPAGDLYFRNRGEDPLRSQHRFKLQNPVPVSGSRLYRRLSAISQPGVLRVRMLSAG